MQMWAAGNDGERYRIRLKKAVPATAWAVDMEGMRALPPPVWAWRFAAARPRSWSVRQTA
jgi:hypothetical protein